MIKTEEILTSSSGKRMFDYVSPIYDQSRVMLSIFEAIGREVDDLQEWIPDIRDQFFPQTATWGLRYWEQRLGLLTNESLPDDVRRANVMAKLTTRYPMTRYRMEQIINRYVPGRSAQVIEYFSEYAFTAIVPIEEDVHFAELRKAVDEAKPAYLSFILSPMVKDTIVISDRVTTSLRRYHKVKEMRAGMPILLSKEELVL